MTTDDSSQSESLEPTVKLTTEQLGDACPIYPGKRYEDWVLDDPSGQPIEVVRGIRDEIKGRVAALLTTLELAPA